RSDFLKGPTSGEDPLGGTRGNNNSSAHTRTYAGLRVPPLPVGVLGLQGSSLEVAGPRGHLADRLVMGESVPRLLDSAGLLGSAVIERMGGRQDRDAGHSRGTVGQSRLLIRALAAEHWISAPQL